MVSIMNVGRGKSFARVVGFATIACLAVSACGAKSGPNQGDSTSTTLPVTSTTISAESSAVLEGYRSFWNAYLAAANPMNPTDPGLAAHATGEELGKVRSTFLARKGAGQVIKGTTDLAPVVKSVNGDKATVTDCYFDHTQVYDASGNPQGTADVERQLVEASLQREDGVWKVAAISHKGSGCTSSS